MAFDPANPCTAVTDIKHKFSAIDSAKISILLLEDASLLILKQVKIGKDTQKCATN